MKPKIYYRFSLITYDVCRALSEAKVSYREGLHIEDEGFCGKAGDYFISNELSRK
jgi:hypothetical protein